MEFLSFMRKLPWRRAGCNPINNDVSVTFGTLRLLRVVFTLSLIAATLACSREDGAGASSAPASLSVSAAATDLGLRDGQKGTNQTALPAESESSASSRRVSATGIATLNADTDGDESQEEVSLCQPASICIKHATSSSPSVYSNPNWHSVSLVAVHDTDGEAGSEVIAVAVSEDGRLACICVIHERTRSIESYRAVAWHTASVFATTDIDGDEAAEVFLLARDELGELQCICVIHDRDRTMHAYNNPAWSVLGSHYLENTDGFPGVELVMEMWDRDNRLVCVCIIHDQTEQIKSYGDSHWRTGIVNQPVDTDGQPGMEVVVSYASGSVSGVVVIHDREEKVSDYRFPGDNPTIQQVADFDSVKGAELCVFLPNSKGLVMIIDRTHEKEAVEMCGPSVGQDRRPAKPPGIT